MYSNLSKEELERIAQQARAKALADYAQNAELNKAHVEKIANVQAQREAGLINDNLADALSYGAKTGVNQMTSGIKSGVMGLQHTGAEMLGMQDTANSLAQKLQQNAQQQAQRQAEINAQHKAPFGMLAQGVADVTSGAIGMLPTVGAFALTPQGKIAAAGKVAQVGAKALGFAPMGLQAGGGGINQALNEGADIGQAKAYGLGTAVKEVATELPFAGIAKVPGIANVGQKIAGGNKFVGGAINAGLEGAEEAMAEAADPYIQRATYNPNAENASLGDMAYSALIGAAIAGAINSSLAGAGKVANMAQNTKKQPKNQQKMGNAVQKPQNGAEQAQAQPMTNTLPRPNNVAQNQSSQADFEQKPVRNIQNQNPVKNTPKISLEMSERNFDNVADKNVKAYQQENPEIKPFQQETAEKLLFDLQNGEKGRREVGIDAETRNVTTMHGIKRNQSEPINRMLNDGLTYDKIEDGLNRIIEDSGKENTPNAKRVELYVHDAMAKGYNSIVDGRVDTNRNYAISKMSLEELEAESDRLGTELATTTDEFKLEEISAQLDNIQKRMDLLRKDISPKLDRPTTSKMETVAENATTQENQAVEKEPVQYQDYDISQMSEEVRDFYEMSNEAGKKYGFNIRVVTGIENGAEGRFDGQGNILLDGNQMIDEATISRVIGHEVYHYLKGTDEHKYIIDLAIKNSGKTKEQLVQEKINDYYVRSKGGVTLDVNAALDEIGAEFMQDILSDPQVAEQIWDTNPTLAERIIRFFEDIINRLQGKAMSDTNRKALAAYQLGLRNMQYQQSQNQGESRYMFAGELSRTADLEALARARQMEAEGADMEAIRQETGWFKSKVTGGEWAYEISDKGIEFSRNAPRFPADFEAQEIRKQMVKALAEEQDFEKYKQLQKQLNELPTDTTPRRDILMDWMSHPELYEAYPQLRNMPFKLDETINANGKFNGDTISVNSSLDKMYTKDGIPIHMEIDDTTKTMLHEVQHAVQEIEGFPRGSSPAYWEGNKIPTKEALQKIADAEKKIADVEAKFRKEWPNDEINLNLVKRYDELDKIYFSGKPANEDRLLAEMAQIEEAAEMAGFDDLLTEYLEAQAELSLAEKYPDYLMPFDAYQNTAGEIMARDTANRRFMDSEQRKQKQPKMGDENTLYADGRSSYSLSDLDSQYMDAVNRGDMETAQRMVDEAAKKAGYGKQLYHQTGNLFTKFNTDNQSAGKYDHETPTGIFLKPDDRDIGLAGKRQMSLLANLQNPLHFADRNSLSYFWKANIPEYADVIQQISENDVRYQALYDEADKRDTELYKKVWEDKRQELITREQFEKILKTGEYEAGNVLKEWQESNNALRLEAKGLIDAYMQASGYDGVIIDRDAGSFGRSTKSYIVFRPEQVKQTDTVTYDDNGNIIPLSQRFNAGNSDIRYSLPNLEHKEQQFSIIQNSNPMLDDYHTGIRSADDILTFEEAIQENIFTPDYTEQAAQNALRKGKITVYSSYPISQGVFVTPSKMEAQLYAGGEGERVYSKTVSLNDVAWIDSLEGQYAKVDNEKMRYSLDDLVDEYGAIPKGEDPYGTNRDIDIPQQTADDNRVSRWGRTAVESSNVDDEAVDEIVARMERGEFTYEPSGNQEQIDRANGLINHTGWEQQLEQFRNKYRSGQAMTADDIVLGERLIQEAQSHGDYKTAVDLIADIAAIGTELGRAVQALSVLKRLTPQGKVQALKRVEERINSGLVEQGKQPVKLPEELLEQMLQAESQQMQSEIWDSCIENMANQVPATLADKINAWRYLAMLSNPKTHIRNMMGNSVMRGVSAVKRGIQTSLENRLLTAGEERYTELNRNVPKEYFDFAEISWQNEGKKRAEASGGRYNDAIGQVERNKRIFNTEWFEKWRKGNENALFGEDMIFKKDAYVKALARYMHANGLAPSELQSVASNASYEKGVAFALNEADKATFQEASKVANLLSRMEHSSPAAKLLMGGALPFKKTPINILKRGVEYSPVGLMNGLYKMRHDVQTGKMTKAEAIDAISAGLTGTGIMVLGYFMASMGMITAGAGEDDERKQWYDQSMGSQNYALVLPNGGTATIDWLAPSVMPLMAGAELYKQLTSENPANENSSAVTSTLEAISKVANPVLEMSMLQGVTDALQSYNSGTTGVLSDLITSTATSYGGQFIPAPVGALARTVDDTVRSSYAPKDSAFTKTGEKFVRQQMNKLPFVSMLNNPSVDVWGNEVERAGGNIVGRAFNNFFNPATYSSDKRTELDKELEKLYSATGESTVLPKAANSSFKYQDKTYYMTPQEKTAYDKTKGQKARQYVSNFVNSDIYNSLDDATKADIIANLYNLANYEAKKQMLKGRGVNDYENSTYEKVLQSGADPVTYYSARKALDNKYNYEDAVAILEELGKLGMSPERYLEVMQATSSINSYDENGKSKKGLKEQRIQAKAKELGLTTQQANFIYKMSSDNWRMYNIWS